MRRGDRRPKGRCPLCRGLFALSDEGLLRQHDHPAGWELAPCGTTLAGGLCAGSKRPAEPVVEEPAAA